MQKCSSGIFLIPFFVFCVALHAQQSSVSPYSRLGLGDFQPQSYTRALGMAGATQALRDALNINYTNPASYTGLKLTTFEVGFELSYLEQKQQNPDITLKNSNSGMRYFAVGVPITDWWGSAAGLQPYTTKGYNISSQRTGPDGIALTDRFAGRGGLNQIYWGNAFKVAEGLSIGINSSFIFGSLEEQNLIEWDNNIYSSRLEEDAKIKGLRFSYGLQYTYPFKNSKELSIGASFANLAKLNANVDRYAYVQDGNGASVDTLASLGTYKSDLTLPNEFSLGLALGKRTDQSMNYAWALTADLELYSGSEFESYNGEKNLENGYKLQIGGFVTPALGFEKESRKHTYFGLVEYRLGAFYEKTPYVVNNQALDNYGITFGFGLPVRQRGLAPGEVKSSMINTGLILGRRGSLQNGLIQESYLNIYIGLTLNDKWFIKYKYR